MKQNMQIPWVKPTFGEAELNEVVSVMKSGWLTQGKKVKDFENQLADYVGVKHAVAVNSGTAALDVAFKAMEIGPGDEVIVPAMAYMATVNAVLFQHATPVFADIDPDTFNLCPKAIEKKITSKTKAIACIDYAGQSVDYDGLRKLTNKYGIKLIEDGAAALGGFFNNKKLCSMGDVSITSFHMAKTFSTIEGGMVFTDSDDYAHKARMIRSQGESPINKYCHCVLGHNYRMTELHAALGLVQTKPDRIESIIGVKRKIADCYLQKLGGCSEIKLPYVGKNCGHAWFLFPVLVNNRDSVRLMLSRKGIETNISWPMPAYETVYCKKYFQELCPVTEDVTKRVLCLPIFHSMQQVEQDYVIETLLELLG